MAAEGSSAELGSGREASQVGPTLGFTSRDDPFSGDRWTGDEMSESAGNLQTGERTPEQEAVDLLMQAEYAQGLEPDYDFESAEGGAGSPYLEDRQSQADLYAADQDGRASGSAGTGLLSGANRTGEGARARYSGTAQAQHARTYDQGPQTVDVVTSSVLNGVFGGAPSRSEAWDGVDAPVQATNRALNQSQERELHTSDRIGTLESLVYQLMEQNEQMRREMTDTQSVSSGESGRGRVGAVQRVVGTAGTGKTAVEGRGTGRYGELGSKPGKGIGGSHGDKWAPTLTTFRPPWTNFAAGDTASMSSMPSEGPGDRLLAATRAMQDLVLQETPEVQVAGLKRSVSVAQPVHLGRMSDVEQPLLFPSPTEVSAAGIPEFQTVGGCSGSGNQMADSSVQQRAAVCPSQHTVGNAVATHASSETSRQATPEVSKGSQRVKVIINGVARSGMINERGEVVVTSESPRYFDIRDNEGDRGRARDETRQAAVEEIRVCSMSVDVSARGNPFSAEATSPFRAAEDQGAMPRSASPPPAPPPSVPPGDGSRVLRSGYRSSSGTRFGYPRKPSRSPIPSPPRVAPMQLRSVNASPMTPGGTKVPPGPPPETPGVDLDGIADAGGQMCEATALNSLPSTEGLLEGSGRSSRDFVPGERTYWELPLLAGPTNEPNPAMRCNDWVYRITPLMSDLAPRANAWWAIVLKEAQAAYQAWAVAKPLERARIVGRPSSELRGNAFTRLESRGVAMLSKALPSVVYEQAL